MGVEDSLTGVTSLEFGTGSGNGGVSRRAASVVSFVVTGAVTAVRVGADPVEACNAVQRFPGLFALQAADVMHVGSVLLRGADAAACDTFGVGGAGDEAPALLALFQVDTFLPCSGGDKFAEEDDVEVNDLGFGGPARREGEGSCS